MGNSTGNKISIEDLSHILIFVGIFLFFAGWVYLYYFYDYFGLSLSLVSLNYTDYVVYSWTVFTSYYWTPLLISLLLIFGYRKWLNRYIFISIILAVLLFAALYMLAKSVARDKAIEIRSSRNTLRQISFVFNEDASLLYHRSDLDSVARVNPDLLPDISILRNLKDTTQLFLLGQNKEYFFVLYQQSSPSRINALPFGRVYFIRKDYLLYSKIIIR
jgi:hypothetical protein